MIQHLRCVHIYWLYSIVRQFIIKFITFYYFTTTNKEMALIPGITNENHNDMVYFASGNEMQSNILNDHEV